MDHKVEVAKKILTIANDHDGQVYGGFVRDVIIPRISDPNCNVSFKDVDIWFRDCVASAHFICQLVKNFKIENDSEFDKELDYSTNGIYNKFFRSQYRIYFQNKFLFNIDVMISIKLPVNDFFINTATYKHTEKGFELTNSYLFREECLQKISIMFSDYNPAGDSYYERINRIFFSKGWTVRCISKHEALSEYITKNKLKVTELKVERFYDYIPIKSNDDKLILDVSLENETLKVDTKLSISDKDILRLIFNNGIDVLSGKLYNSIEDKELQTIYKFGLEDYRTRIDNFLK